MSNNLQEEIVSFKNNVGLPNVSIPEEINSILNASRSQLKSKNKEEIGLDCVRLSQYSLYIRGQINQLKAKLVWCKTNIDSIVSREISNLKGIYGLEEKRLTMIKNDPNAKKLHETQIATEVKLQYLDDIDRKIEFMAKVIYNLSYKD